MVDPRRRIDAKYDRPQVPFVETRRETVLEQQPVGGPLEREILVVRIDKAKLKAYSFIAAVVILIFIISAIWG
jgi:hypothetical protein